MRALLEKLDGAEWLLMSVPEATDRLYDHLSTLIREIDGESYHIRPSGDPGAMLLAALVTKLRLWVASAELDGGRLADDHRLKVRWEEHSVAVTREAILGAYMDIERVVKATLGLSSRGGKLLGPGKIQASWKEWYSDGKKAFSTKIIEAVTKNLDNGGKGENAVPRSRTEQASAGVHGELASKHTNTGREHDHLRGKGDEGKGTAATTSTRKSWAEIVRQPPRPSDASTGRKEDESRPTATKVPTRKSWAEIPQQAPREKDTAQAKGKSGTRPRHPASSSSSTAHASGVYGPSDAGPLPDHSLGAQGQRPARRPHPAPRSPPRPTRVLHIPLRLVPGSITPDRARQWRAVRRMLADIGVAESTISTTITHEVYRAAACPSTLYAYIMMPTLKSADEIVTVAAAKARDLGRRPAVEYARHPWKMERLASRSGPPATLYAPAPSRHPRCARTQKSQQRSAPATDSPREQESHEAADTEGSGMEVDENRDNSLGAVFQRLSKELTSGKEARRKGAPVEGTSTGAERDGEPQKNEQGQKGQRQRPLHGRKTSMAGRVPLSPEPPLKKGTGTFGLPVASQLRRSPLSRACSRATPLAAGEMCSLRSATPERQAERERQEAPCGAQATILSDSDAPSAWAKQHEEHLTPCDAPSESRSQPRNHEQRLQQKQLLLPQSTTPATPPRSPSPMLDLEEPAELAPDGEQQAHPPLESTPSQAFGLSPGSPGSL